MSDEDTGDDDGEDDEDDDIQANPVRQTEGQTDRQREGEQLDKWRNRLAMQSCYMQASFELSEL